MKILVLFAHPRPSLSVVQRALRAAIERLDGIDLRDLYAEYPDFAIDVPREQALLLAHDLIVLQHPLYWYSSPAIIKEWLDLVLEQGWAYGPHGDRLHGKFLMSAVSTGGSDSAYRDGGHNRFAIHHLLSPFDQTAHLCGMAWLEPFVVHQGRRLEPDNLARAAETYRDLIVGLRDGRIEPLQRLAPGYALPQGFGPRAA
jgi:glutathione-regulated potassium-efflux system ancillary protein KefG